MGDDLTIKVNNLKDQGNTALNAGRLEEAIKYYSEAIELDPTNHVLYSNRSAAYIKINKCAEALSDAEKTVQIKPDWPKGYSRKGAALAYLKRHNEALKAYEDGLKHDPNNQQLKDAIFEVETSMRATSNRPFGSPFTDPSMFMKLQNDPRTREYLKDPSFLKMLAELQQDPNNAMAALKDDRLLTALQVILGVNLSGNMSGDDEEMHMDETESQTNHTSPPSTKPGSAKRKEPSPEPQISPERKEALEEKEAGNAAYKRRDFEKALLHYDKAIALDPSDMTFLNNKAAVYFEQKCFEDCIKQCETAIEIGREDRADFKVIAKAYSRMASAYVKLKDLSKARTFYQKSLTEHRTPETLSKLSEVDKVLKEEERKMYIDPEKALEEKNMGNEYFQKGDYPTALKHYSEAIKRNPEDAKLYSNRAACYQKLAEFPLALKDCELCVKLDPSFVKAHIRKGLALTALKEHSKAAMAFQKALELDPGSQEALDGYRKCSLATNSDPEEVRKRAMGDPEVQKILTDPAMRIILEQMQSDPKAVSEHLKNPDIAAKIQKLMESGLITIR